MSPVLAVLVVSWLIVGALVAIAQPPATRAPGLWITALLAWPILLGREDPRTSPTKDAAGTAQPDPTAAQAPRADALSERIHHAFSQVRADLDAPSFGEPPIDVAELLAFEAPLIRAADRLAAVDLILADAAIGDAGHALVAARDKSRDDMDLALADLVAVRVQLALFTLAGDSAPVRVPLRSLAARVRALDEPGTP